MGALNWLLSTITGIRLPESAEAPPQPGSAREAYGITVDNDEAEWRKLSGQSDRDLMPMAQDKMQRLAHYTWESNLLGNRLIELPLAFLLAKGVRLTIQDEKLQKALDRHWRDGVNCWPIKLAKKVRELALFGEQCWPVFVGETGFVRIGYLDPAAIATVVMDPENAEQPIGVVTKRNGKGKVRRYRVIVNAPENAFSARTQQIRSEFTDGQCFFFKVNDLCSGSRGRSDLLAQIDWLDAYDEFLFGEVERANFFRAFFLDVTLTGATEEQVAEKARSISAPRPGSVRVHNEQETWKYETAELGAYEASASARLFRNHVLGGATMPEHWYGGGGDVNRSTGSSMSEPTEKSYEMRQTFVGFMLEEVGRFVARAALGKLDEELSEDEEELLDTLKVEWPGMTAKDTTKYAAALQQAVSAAASAIAEGLMTRETALRIVAAMAAQLGVEIDVDAELEAAEKERAERGGDAFTDPVIDDGANAGAPAVPVDAEDAAAKAAATRTGEAG